MPAQPSLVVCRESAAAVLMGQACAPHPRRAVRWHRRQQARHGDSKRRCNKAQKGSHLRLGQRGAFGECRRGKEAGDCEPDRGDETDDEQIGQPKSGRQVATGQSRHAREQDSDRLSKQEAGDDVVCAGSDIRQRDGRIREPEQEQDDLDGCRPPAQTCSTCRAGTPRARQRRQDLAHPPSPPVAAP